MLATVWPVTCHTDYVGNGSTFVAINGFHHDGTQFIPLALQRGATTIVIAEDAILSDEILFQIRAVEAELVAVENPRLALEQLSAQAWGYPARCMKIIGVTGTKGKTTTVQIIAHMLRSMGECVAFVSTAGNGIHDVSYPSSLTTPQPDYLHMFLAHARAHGVQWVVLEVAAQALSLSRIASIQFDAALFTNFSYEHGEFYADQNDYFVAKMRLFEQLKEHSPCIINYDDAACHEVLKTDRMVHTYSREHDAATVRLHGDNFFQGILGRVEIDEKAFDIHVPALIGEFNAYNILAALTTVYALNFNMQAAAQQCTTFAGVPGRMQVIAKQKNIRFIIDYAHNPASYESLLSTLCQMTSELIVVFGAGGERDVTKRPIMGEIAAQYAHTLFLTSDNPRSEDPAHIVRDIFAGIPEELRDNVHIDLDRAHAIAIAYQQAGEGAIIALLGKGCDEYQIVGGVKTHFSEAEIINTLQ